jgi:outer membrane protein OmpA-like peptidoglycan-associated protein
MSGFLRLFGAAFAIVVTAALASAAMAADSTSFMGKKPNAQELINALTPAPTAKMRGLAPTGAGQTAGPAAAQPSASLDVKFGFNSASLTADAEETLSELGKALKSDQLTKSAFSIVGHTDAKGSLNYNRKLSEKRAQAVKDFLTAKFGIEPGRLDVTGKGPTALLDPKNPESGVNRRVEIVNRGS